MDRQSSARWFGALGGDGLCQIWGLRKALTIIYAIPSYNPDCVFWTATAVSCITQTRYAASLQENSCPLRYCSIDIAATDGLPTSLPGYAAPSVLKQQKLHDLPIIACATGNLNAQLSCCSRRRGRYAPGPVLHQGPPLPAVEPAAARLAVAPSRSSLLHDRCWLYSLLPSLAARRASSIRARACPAWMNA